MYSAINRGGASACAVLCLILSGCGAAVDVTQLARDQNLEKRVRNLIEMAGFTFPVRVVIDGRPGVNAYSTERGETWHIAVNPEFFGGLSETEQTGVLGHESAHLIYRHVGKAQEYESELAADEWAGWLLHRCGISEREASSLWGKLGNATASHPDSQFRVEAAIKGWRLGETQDRDMLGALAGRVRSLEEEMSQQAAQTATLRAAKQQLDRDLSDALAAKRWSMIAGASGAALALVMGAWLFFRRGKVSQNDDGRDRAAGLAARVRGSFGPHMHENPVCRRVWREVEPLLERYADDESGFERAMASSILDPSNEEARLSVEDRKTAMRILLAA